MNTITIDNFKIGRDQPCAIISEIGGMYEDRDGMKLLIKMSREAGANAVKIQTYRAETITLPDAEFEFEDGSRMSQIDFFKRYEISREDHKILFDYAKEVGITMFSTPSYYDDVDFLDELGVPAFKIGSDDLTNYPFLKYIARKGKPVIISTGMSTMSEVEEAVNTIVNTGNDKLILLHCTVSYPPEPEFANLNVIQTLHSAFGLPVGYSDHLKGVFSSVLAASMGACVIEKHVTLARNLKRPDYQVSLEPSELRKMVGQIHLATVLKGSSIKQVYPTEKKWRINARKSLFAAHNLKKGDIIKEKDIKIIRPGNGIQPGCLNLFVGKSLKRDVAKNTMILDDAI